MTTFRQLWTGRVLLALAAFNTVLNYISNWQTLMSLNAFVTILFSQWTSLALFLAGILILAWLRYGEQSASSQAPVLYGPTGQRLMPSGVRHDLLSNFVLSIGGGVLCGAVVFGVIWASERIQSHSQPHIHVLKYEPFAATPDDSAKVNMMYINTGGSTATFEATAFIHFEPVLPSTTEGINVEEEAFFQYVKAAANQPHGTTSSLGRDIKVWSTLTGPVLDAPHVEGLTKNSVLLAAGVLRYVGIKKNDVEFCFYWDSTRIVHLCQKHNTE